MGWKDDILKEKNIEIIFEKMDSSIDELNKQKGQCQIAIENNSEEYIKAELGQELEQIEKEIEQKEIIKKQAVDKVKAVLKIQEEETTLTKAIQEMEKNKEDCASELEKYKYKIHDNVKNELTAELNRINEDLVNLKGKLEETKDIKGGHKNFFIKLATKLGLTEKSFEEKEEPEERGSDDDIIETPEIDEFTSKKKKGRELAPQLEPGDPKDFRLNNPISKGFGGNPIVPIPEQENELESEPDKPKKITPNDSIPKGFVDTPKPRSRIESTQLRKDKEYAEQMQQFMKNQNEELALVKVSFWKKIWKNIVNLKNKIFVKDRKESKEIRKEIEEHMRNEKQDDIEVGKKAKEMAPFLQFSGLNRDQTINSYGLEELKKEQEEANRMEAFLNNQKEEEKSFKEKLKVDKMQQVTNILLKKRENQNDDISVINATKGNKGSQIKDVDNKMLKEDEDEDVR